MNIFRESDPSPLALLRRWQLSSSLGSRRLPFRFPLDLVLNPRLQRQEVAEVVVRVDSLAPKEERQLQRVVERLELCLIWPQSEVIRANIDEGRSIFAARTAIRAD